MLVLEIIGIIILSLILLIFLFTLLPIQLILKFHKEETLQIFIKFLWWEINPNEISKEEETKSPKPKVKKSFKEHIETAKTTLKKVKVVLSKLQGVLKHCQLKKLYLKFISTGEDAATAAMNYGIACSVIYPVASYIQSAIKTKPSKTDIQVGCLFEDAPFTFEFETIISIKILFLLIKGINIYKELKKVDQNEEE